MVEYADYECPYCALADGLLASLPVRRIFRHFPVSSKHPRARALACAAEAAALQGSFWPMHESLFADPGHVDDPHLWRRAQALGLDLERFEADRRSDALAERVRRDFRSGVSAGVVTTPTLFVEGEAHPGVPSAELLERLKRGGRATPTPSPPREPGPRRAAPPSPALEMAPMTHRLELRVPGQPEPLSHYTDAVRAGDLLFVSGCIALDAEGALVGEGDVVAQARQAFGNLGAILRAGGCGFPDVVKVTVFLTDVDDRARINPVRQELFGEARPASTLVEVSRLAVPGALIEVEAVASIP